MRLNKRIADLEARQVSLSNLANLSDEELREHAFRLIRQFEAAGVALPLDWREQYDRNEVRFLEWLGAEGEKLACEA